MIYWNLMGQLNNMRIRTLICKRCKTDNAIIRQAQDSYYKEVYCLKCEYREWLKNYNKLNSSTISTETKLCTKELSC